MTCWLVFFHVLLEVTAVSKSCSTNGTFIWSFTRVRPQMRRQVGLLGKSLSARWTFKGFDPVMSHQMYVQLRLRYKRLVTELTATVSAAA